MNEGVGKRRFPRFIGPIRVMVEREGVRRKASVSHVSVAGGYLEDFPLSPKGTTLAVTFVARNGEELMLGAEVVGVHVGQSGHVPGMGIAWVGEGVERSKFAIEIAELARARKPFLPPLTRDNRLRYASVTLACLAFYVVCLFHGVQLSVLKALELGYVGQLVLGSTGAACVAFALLLAARRRGWLRLRVRGGFHVWIALHIWAIVFAMFILGAHVAGRRGGGVALLCSIAFGLTVLSSLPGLLIWQQFPSSRLGVIMQRHWMKVHIALIGPLLVTLCWHILQVIYY